MAGALILGNYFLAKLLDHQQPPICFEVVVTPLGIYEV